MTRAEGKNVIKIPSLFKRDYAGTRQVFDEYVEGSLEVARDGVPTIKWDGTAVMFRGGKMFRRYDCKAGKTPPAAFTPCQPEPDPVSGHWPGWIPIEENNPADRWHFEAWKRESDREDGTYELIGPHINGNPHRCPSIAGLAALDLLIPHGADPLPVDEVGFTFESVRAYLGQHVIEGIVWHHPDRRMVKIKRKDFGYSWP